MADEVLKKCLVAILIMSLLKEGNCDCSLNDIKVGTERTGKEIEGKPEWRVTVTNDCKCPQKQIRFVCKGFQTAEDLNDMILRVEGDNCLLLDGNPLRGFASIKFQYAWDPPFLLMPVSSEVDTSLCSSV